MPDAAVKIKFHLDEHIDAAVARAVRQAGADVTTTSDAGLRSASDKTQLEVAVADTRVTDDADFLRMSKDGASHWGIVFCLRRLRSVGDIIREMISLYRTTTPEEMKGRVVFVTKKSA